MNNYETIHEEIYNQEIDEAKRISESLSVGKEELKEKYKDFFTENTITEKLYNFLGKKGIQFFRVLSVLYKGDVIPVIKTKYYPHAVHFHEAMQIRNFLRTIPETEKWTDHDFDNRYVHYIKKVIELDKQKNE